MSEPVIKILVDVKDFEALLRCAADCSCRVDKEIRERYEPLIERARRAR